MNNYGGLGALMALAQMSPEQYQTGLDRFNQFQQRYSSMQAPSSSQPIVSQPSTAQPTMTSVDNAEGGFGTGSNPYTQPYYSRSFGQNMQAPGYYGRSFMPMSGGLYGQTQYGFGSPSYSSGKGGSMPSYRSGAGKGGYF